MTLAAGYERSHSIWLSRTVQGPPGTPWWVLDGDGVLTRTVELPRGLRLLWADADHVWGVETDEIDVNYLVRYGLERVSSH